MSFRQYVREYGRSSQPARTGSAQNGPATAKEQFATGVMQILSADRAEWTADTAARIGNLARTSGLGGLSRRGYFVPNGASQGLEKNATPLQAFGEQVIVVLAADRTWTADTARTIGHLAHLAFDLALAPSAAVGDSTGQAISAPAP
jgi:hypothetical protein